MEHSNDPTKNYHHSFSAQRLWQLTRLYEHRRSGVYGREIPSQDELEGLARILTLPENQDLARYTFGLINGSLEKGIPEVRRALEEELRRYIQPETPTRTESCT